MISAGKRILIVGMNFAPELTGVGRYTGDLAPELAARGHEVTVITAAPHYPGWKVQSPYRNRYCVRMEEGVRVQRCPIVLREAMQGIWRLIAPISFAIASAPLVVWNILIRRPDVILCVEPTLLAAPTALICCIITSSRSVLHVQDLEIDAAFAVGHLSARGWLRALALRFERTCLRRFTRVVTISERMRESLVRKGVEEKRTVVIRNWVDLEHISPGPIDTAYRRELGIQPDRFVVLYSGNIGAKQGLDVLLGAMERLKDKTNIECVIAGEGPAKSALIEGWGHLPNVHFIAFQPYERLNTFLGLADLHIIPQDGNAADLVLPSKLGGILASGRPLVVTAHPGTELVDFLGEAALIVPPGNVEALAAAIATAASAVEADLHGSLCRRNLAGVLDREAAMDQFEAVLIS